jgi:hypothetical protein
MNTSSDWRNLTLLEFISRYCRKPLSKALRALVNDATRLGTMADLASESDIRRLRRVGPQSAAEIIRGRFVIPAMITADPSRTVLGATGGKIGFFGATPVPPTGWGGSSGGDAREHRR